MNRLCRQAIVIVLCCSSALLADDLPHSPAQLTYETHIRPVFRAYCFDCHGGGEAFKGGLDLRLRRLMVKGGDSGAAITPGSPSKSLLLERIRNGEMPPREMKVPKQDIETIATWIAAGAKTARPELEKLGKGIGVSFDERSFWAFQPIRRPVVPKFAAEDRVRTPIDALLLAAMRKRGLSFSSDAARITLLKRAVFDLIGLPPTLHQVREFLDDESPDAYERLIDGLLKSPQYGERWGRHWLDVAGYADSEGDTNADAVRSYSYKYRDYVIRSLNADKPFDRFLQEQLAGDELVPLPHENLTPLQIETLVATGFLRMAADGTGSGANTADARNQVLADTIKIVSTSLLGLSIGCAQCHDHRYDPIPQSDYYRLRAVFEPAYDWKQWRTPAQRKVSLSTQADRDRAAEIEVEAKKIVAEKSGKQAEHLAAALEKELSQYDEELRDKLRTAYQTPVNKRTAEQKRLLKQHPSINITPGLLYLYNQAAADDLKKYDVRIAAVRAKKPVEDFIRMLTEVPGQVPTTFLFHRGDHKQPKHEISPGGLTIASASGRRVEFPANNAELPTTGRRLAYARWLTGGKHPLVARVLVNRIWMHHFGRGLVGSPSDFGKLGERPTHPELLDWLANEFMDQGWHLKKLHKLIMTSTAYRQSSLRDPQNDKIDPDNLLYGRKSIRRLEAEAIRDRILATSGLLSQQMFGSPVFVKADDTGKVVVGGDQSRRSLYIQVRRSQPVALLKAFDAPVMETNCQRRSSSTVATQSLILMNSDFILNQAKRFAHRIIGEWSSGDGFDGPPLTQQVAYAWQLAYARPATHEEIKVSLEFLSQQISHLKKHGSAKKSDPELQALTNFCQVLFGSNEFLYVD